MASGSKTFATPAFSTERQGSAADQSNLLQIGLVFGLILVAVWMPQGRFNSAVCLAATFFTILLTFTSHRSNRELGLTQPFSGAWVILAFGAVFVLTIIAAGALTRSLGPPQPLPWHRAWQYAIWSLLQQFILQSFIFVRLESVFGGRRAVPGAALLFAMAHLPSPLLTVLSLLGALFFCEMFRRYRNIFPLGLVHAALGLTIASSLPDHWLHHMRVGLGYLAYHV